MPPAIFQLLNKTRREYDGYPPTSTLPPPFRDERCPFYERLRRDRTTAHYQLDYGQIPPVNFDSGLRILTVAFSAWPFPLPVSGVPLSHGQPVTPTAIIADEATRLMAIAAAPGHRRFADTAEVFNACSRPFMAIHPPFSGDG
ncbi:hypothetical protein EH61_16490 [Escherichia coli]|nr:hypothetical protein EH61_16490 [Escherichia coli]